MQLFTHSLTSVAFNEKQTNKQTNKQTTTQRINNPHKKQQKKNKQTNKQKEEHVVCDPGYSIFVNGPYDNYHQ